MLTASQYEPIGRLTLAFNEVDFMVESYFAHFLATPEPPVSILIAGEDQIYRKAERFRDVLKAMVAHRAELVDVAGTVIGLLETTKSLAKKRNDYVHALVVENYGTRETRIRIKKSDERVCDENEIKVLETQMIQLARDLDYECFVLLQRLIEARNSDPPQQKIVATPFSQ
jgi:hypothetical protein